MILKIEKLIYGGDGLARLPADGDGRGKAVFIPFVLAGEKIEAALIESKSGFARARASAILEPSPHRVSPACPYFGRCGGCHYQHASYEHQLEIKKEILRENLRRIAKIELQEEIQTHPSPPWNYRNRSRLQIRTKPDFALGYFRFASHDVLPVEQCPISSPLINRGIAALWQSGRAEKGADGVREAEFFANADDSRLLLELLCAPEAKRSAVRIWAEELCAAMPEIVGIVAFRERQKNVRELMVTVGASELTYHTRHAAYRVSAGAFFQTNRFLTDELIEIVAAGAAGELALDLYAGVGLFSTALARDIRHIISVETSPSAAGDLKYNQPVNGQAVQAETDEYLAGILDKSRDGGGKSLPQLPLKPDFVVMDPPRGGLGERVAHLLAGVGAPRVTYVSCDPATLARDLVPLLAAGYRLQEVHLVDLFPQTYHLESVVKLAR
ncbi:MAG: 23S rRNA (uracil(1939)-C(5))-methyltransferase RlmD [Candidatus Sulfotelmatobacter sp.]